VGRCQSKRGKKSTRGGRPDSERRERQAKRFARILNLQELLQGRFPYNSLHKLDVTADVPEDFDLRAYFGDAWAVFRGDRSYHVEVRFAPEAAPLVIETTWHHTQQARRHKDGSVTLTFRVDGLEEIARWLLGWAGWVEVVRPAELRAMVVEQLRRALELNATGQESHHV
jgi:predicted DNA-binding transcriptional regulator YafY